MKVLKMHPLKIFVVVITSKLLTVSLHVLRTNTNINRFRSDKLVVTLMKTACKILEPKIITFCNYKSTSSREALQEILPLREKCSNTEFFWSVFSSFQTR